MCMFTLLNTCSIFFGFFVDVTVSRKIPSKALQVIVLVYTQTDMEEAAITSLRITLR